MPTPEPASKPVSKPLTPRASRQPAAVRTALLALSAIGLVLPWVWNIRWFLDGGSVAPQVFWPAAMANALTTAITLDVYLAAAGFSAWVLAERAVRRPLLVVLACFGLGLAFALPLYLALRRPDGPQVSA